MRKFHKDRGLTAVHSILIQPPLSARQQQRIADTTRERKYSWNPHISDQTNRWIASVSWKSNCITFFCRVRKRAWDEKAVRRGCMRCEYHSLLQQTEDVDLCNSIIFHHSKRWNDLSAPHFSTSAGKEFFKHHQSQKQTNSHEITIRRWHDITDE